MTTDIHDCADGGQTPCPVTAVLERQVRVTWPEAIAIVHQTCAALQQHAGIDTGGVDQRAVFLCDDGRVEVHPAGGEEPAPAALTRMLHALASGDAPPPAVRLLIGKWVAYDGSLADFATELAFFARPNASELIRAVYARTAAHSGPPPSVVPLPIADRPAAHAPVPRRRVSRRVHVAVAATACAAAVGVLVASLVPPGADQQRRESVSTTLAGAAATVRQLGVGLGARFGLGVSSERDEAAASRPASVATTSGSRRRMPHRPALEAITSQAITTPAAPTAAFAAPGLPLDETEDVAPRVAEKPEAARTRGFAARIYTATNAEVSPPTLLSPHLAAPRARSTEDVNTMEVLISPEGVVERVRLLSSPRRLTDMMLLSGAKTWRFAPASLDGEPVRYRLRMSWAATP